MEKMIAFLYKKKKKKTIPLAGLGGICDEPRIDVISSPSGGGRSTEASLSLK